MNDPRRAIVDAIEMLHALHKLTHVRFVGGSLERGVLALKRVERTDERVELRLQDREVANECFGLLRRELEQRRSGAFIS